MRRLSAFAELFIIFLGLVHGIPNPAHSRERTRVLLTAFEPFGGRKENGSQLTAEALARRNSDSADIHYEVCILPVEYEKAAKKALECHDKMNPKPDMVIATGEGDCTLRMETQAHNLNDTPYFPDNAGVFRVKTQIDGSGPDDERLTLPVTDMFCAAEFEMDAPVSVSLSPGYYVCNDIAYRLARHFKPQQIPFGFIHVPAAGMCLIPPEKTAEKLNRAVQAAARALRIPTTVFSRRFDASGSGCPDGASSPTEAETQVRALTPFVTAACKAQVRHQMRIKLEEQRRMMIRPRGDVR